MTDHPSALVSVPEMKTLSAGERAFTAWAATSRADGTPLMWTRSEMPHSQQERWEKIALAAATAPSSLAGGEVWTRLIETLKRIEDGLHASLNDQAEAILSVLSSEPPAEDEARRKLIQCIEQWDGETEYDADDLASLADSILHAFNGPPVVSPDAPAQLSSDPCQLEAPAEGAGEWNPTRGQVINAICNSSPFGPDYKHPDLLRMSDAILALRARSSAPEVRRPIELMRTREWRFIVGYSNDDENGGFTSLGDITDQLAALYPKSEAREVGVPVAWRWRLSPGRDWWVSVKPFEAGENEGEVQPLYTHPAPDALRVAVEALEALAGQEGDCGEKVYVPCTWKPFREVARQALAALQAEQGAK